MKILRFFQNQLFLFAALLIVGLLSSLSVTAQTCSSTETVSAPITTQFIFGASNDCLVVTEDGSIIRGSSTAVSNTTFTGVRILNSGTIQALGGVVNSSQGGIEYLYNTGTISGDAFNWGISNGYLSTITTLTNERVISGGWGIVNAGEITQLNNNIGGAINATSIGLVGFEGTISNISNSGTITGEESGIYNFLRSSIVTLNNNVGGIISGNRVPNYSGDGSGIFNEGTISSLNNSGAILSTHAYGLINAATGTISTITNIGTISGALYDISNFGIITTLNNSQGTASSALTYEGVLPTNYNIIINSPTSFGKLAVVNGTGTTTFGIASGSTVRNGRYSSVLAGLQSSSSFLVGPTSGSYGGGTWLLTEVDSLNGIWDLIFSGFISGPSSDDTQASMSVIANRLRGIYSLQSTALVNGLSYDCQVFDKNNICLSTGGRYSNNSGALGNSTSALLIGAYRLNKNVRIGAWIDQNLSTNTTTGVNLGNSKPLFGVFGAWAENPTGEGYEVKVSAGYGDKDLAVTRDVIGTSEAGFGTSRLKSQAVSSVSSYGFRINNEMLASPYVGIRYSRIASNGYTEFGSDTVTTPLSYNKLNQENIALLAGLKLSVKLDPKTTFVASAGVEQNLKNRSGQYSATGLDGLTSIEFNTNPQKTRATASLGAYYDIDKKQRVAVNGIYREETFNPIATTSILATYTVGF